jgi:hypothetical protein
MREIRIVLLISIFVLAVGSYIKDLCARVVDPVKSGHAFCPALINIFDFPKDVEKAISSLHIVTDIVGREGLRNRVDLIEFATIKNAFSYRTSVHNGLHIGPCSLVRKEHDGRIDCGYQCGRFANIDIIEFNSPEIAIKATLSIRSSCTE